MQKLSKVLVLLFGIFIFSVVNSSAEPVSSLPVAHPTFESIDTNSDAAIDLDEMHAHQAQKFEQADKDKDGLLNAEELKSEHGQIFKKADHNNDNQVTKEEAKSQFSQYFDQIDNNNDGKINAQEHSDNWKGVIYF
ncbi:MAG: hypothetical protein WC543_06425 [Candidatus Omnitrophota bacterium]